MWIPKHEVSMNYVYDLHRPGLILNVIYTHASTHQYSKSCPLCMMVWTVFRLAHCTSTILAHTEARDTLRLFTSAVVRRWCNLDLRDPGKTCWCDGGGVIDGVVNGVKVNSIAPSESSLVKFCAKLCAKMAIKHLYLKKKKLCRIVLKKIKVPVLQVLRKKLKFCADSRKFGVDMRPCVPLF